MRKGIIIVVSIIFTVLFIIGLSSKNWGKK